ncbi:3-hydroxyacyl-CoA dehydrogenase NAD-binding domain-containing protein [Curvivirga sp.]|uniref:3-hydroxyacyl-CoA dehydrogenase NAD-binding domain-containing protein n=1 Tax=Curvivirga sp. TaxID=2856848 RepID=UPI003B59816B
MVVSIERRDHLAIVKVDNPPVNALSAAVRKGLYDAANELDQDDTIDQIILICEGRTFIAGADISEFGKPPQEPTLPEVISAIENSCKTWIAAIHGTSLGGGFEIALACTYRVMARGAKIGLPEVNLGLIPGAGGTIRLPRLICVSKATDMITSGKPVNADTAMQMGACTYISENDLLEDTVAYAAIIKDKLHPLPLKDRDVIGPKHDRFWDEKKAELLKKTKGQVSPLRALQSIKNACELSFSDALEQERQIFIECRNSAESTALRHMFFAERKATNPDWLDKSLIKDLKKIAVIGGGTMGAGITVALQNAGYQVTLVERDQESLDRGISNITKLYQGSLKRGLLNEKKLHENLSSLGQEVGYSNLSDTDLVIEAVFEDMTVKQTLFKELDKVCRSDTILATNTSYLDPNKFSDVISNPERMIGIHFFSPAHIMKLVEVIKTDHTSDEIIATAFGLAKKLRKIPVLAGVCDGFIGNRILKTYRKQAEQLLLEGCYPSEVDKVMRKFGMSMGPFEAQDLGGLDIAFAQRQNAAQNGMPVYAPVSDALCALKRFGQKSQGGWYDYEEGDRTPIASDEVASIIETLRQDGDATIQDFSEEEILDRILSAMRAEGEAMLSEGIAKAPVDIDLVEVFGFGFPRWRGGLMHYAESIKN